MGKARRRVAAGTAENEKLQRGGCPAEKFTSDATLITIAADALAELDSEEYDGRTVVFTVRGNFASAKISATLKYAEPVPIDQTPDGQAKILKATDGGQSATFTFGHEWIVKTVNMFGDGREHTGVDWAFGEVMVCTNEGTSGPSAMMLGIYSDDGTRLTINSDSGSIPPGTYANATINIMGLKHGETEPVILHVPINLVVEG